MCHSEETEPKDAMGFQKTISRFIKNVHVEVPIFLLYFTFKMNAPVFANLLVYRTCYVTLGYNESDCALLGTAYSNERTAELERASQPYANIMSMANNFFFSMMCAIACLFLGPWSDKHGRIPVFYLCLSCFFVGGLIAVVLCLYKYTSPWLFLIETCMIALTGGLPSYLAICLCYVTDVTDEKNRGTRMGFLESAVTLGTLMGTFLSSYVFNFVGYVGIFASCSAIVAFVAVYTYFLIPESVVVKKIEDENSLIDIFTTTHLKDMIKVVFKPREKRKRAILICSIVLLVFYIYQHYNNSVIFLYLRESFAWSLEQFTVFKTIYLSLWIVGTMFVVGVLHKVLRISETVLLLVGFLSMLNGALMFGLASRSWHIYAGACLKILGGGISPMARSLISKTVPSNEIGKVFAFIVALETLSGMIACPMYTFVYNSTLETMPSVYNFITAGIFVLCLVIVLVIMFLRRLQERDGYEEIQ